MPYDPEEVDFAALGRQATGRQPGATPDEDVDFLTLGRAALEGKPFEQAPPTIDVQPIGVERPGGLPEEGPILGEPAEEEPGFLERMSMAAGPMFAGVPTRPIAGALGAARDIGLGMTVPPAEPVEGVQPPSAMLAVQDPLAYQQAMAEYQMQPEAGLEAVEKGAELPAWLPHGEKPGLTVPTYTAEQIPDRGKRFLANLVPNFIELVGFAGPQLTTEVGVGLAEGDVDEVKEMLGALLHDAMNMPVDAAKAAATMTTLEIARKNPKLIPPLLEIAKSVSQGDDPIRKTITDFAVGLGMDVDDYLTRLADEPAFTLMFSLGPAAGPGLAKKGKKAYKEALSEYRETGKLPGFELPKKKGGPDIPGRVFDEARERLVEPPEGYERAEVVDVPERPGEAQPGADVVNLAEVRGRAREPELRPARVQALEQKIRDLEEKRAELERIDDEIREREFQQAMKDGTLDEYMDGINLPEHFSERMEIDRLISELGRQRDKARRGVTAEAEAARGKEQTAEWMRQREENRAAGERLREAGRPEREPRRPGEVAELPPEAPPVREGVEAGPPLPLRQMEARERAAAEAPTEPAPAPEPARPVEAPPAEAPAPATGWRMARAANGKLIADMSDRQAAIDTARMLEKQNPDKRYDVQDQGDGRWRVLEAAREAAPEKPAPPAAPPKPEAEPAPKVEEPEGQTGIEPAGEVPARTSPAPKAETKAKPKAEPEPEPEGYTVGQDVRYGKRKVQVREVLPDNKYRVKIKGQRQPVVVDGAKLREWKVSIKDKRHRPKIVLEREDLSDNKKVARYIAQGGGIWDEGLKGDMRGLRENYGNPGLVSKKTGRSLDSWAESLAEEGLFIDRDAAYRFLDDWMGGKTYREQAPGVGMAGRPYDQMSPTEISKRIDQIHERLHEIKDRDSTRAWDEQNRLTEELADLEAEEVARGQRPDAERLVVEGESPEIAFAQGYEDGMRGLPKHDWEWEGGIRSDYELGYAKGVEVAKKEGRGGSLGSAARGPRERALPGMEKERASVERAAAKREKAEAAGAVVERKRAKDVERGQGSLIDEETGKRIEERAGEIERAREAETAQAQIPGAERAPLPKGYGDANKLITKQKADAARQRLKKKTGRLFSGVDPTTVREFVELGAYHAEALARQTASGVADFASWAQRMTAEGVNKGYLLTREMLKKLWKSERIQAARVQGALTARPAPQARGRLRAFTREAQQRGQVGFDEWRRTNNRINMLNRAVNTDTRKRFKGLTKEAQNAIAVVARGIAPSGKYGTIVRAGTLRAYKRGKRVIAQAGTALPDGRFIGRDLPGKRDAQLYRVIWPDEAEALHKELRTDFPDAARVLDDFLAVEEAEVFTAAGDRVPAFSRKRLKEQFDVEGLTAEEARDASYLIRRALGEEANGRTIPNEMSWVPEGTLTRPAKFIGRLRNAMRPTTAGVRRKKTGAAFEKARAEGTLLDFQRATEQARRELAREQLHNEMVPKLLALLAEPIPKHANIGMIEANNYRVLSHGLWRESQAVRNFFKRHQKWFEEQGIDVPNAVDATYFSQGKGYMVPSVLVDALAPHFEKKAKSVNRRYQGTLDAFDNLGGRVIGAINVWRLTRPSTAVRNLVSNQIIYTSKVLRDFYYEMILEGMRAGQKLRGTAGPRQMAPFVHTIADFRAIGTSLGKKSRKRIPVEMLGHTFLDELQQGGTVARLGGKVLRVNGFNAADVYTKRLIYEAVIDGNARQAWHTAKRMNETGGRTKAQFIEDYKNNVPKDIESLAYREMDTWGGYDYQNVGPMLEKLKRSKTFRAIVPYPTYYYKLMGSYRELFGIHNVATLMDKKAGTKARAMAAANLMSGATMVALMWQLTKPDGELPEEINEQDIPYEYQRFGRLKVGEVAGEGAWVRLYDLPFLGEVMAARAIFGNELSVGDYLNDRIALGPLFNLVAFTAGMSNRFNKDMPVASRLGREVASWFPLQAENQAVRRLLDPKKREPGREDESYAFKNFARSFADNYPMLSFMLEPKFSMVRMRTPVYHPAEVTLSYFLLNTRFVDETERERAINLARLSALEDKKSRIKMETVRDLVAPLMDEKGRTLAGEIKKATRVEPREVDEATAKAHFGIHVLQAFQEGGSEKAEEALRWLRGEYAMMAKRREIHKEAIAPAIKSATKLLQDLTQLERGGPAYQEFKAAPPEVQREFEPRVKEEIGGFKEKRVRIRKAE